jgi:ubiquitin-activating enzyme E1
LREEYAKIDGPTEKETEDLGNNVSNIDYEFYAVEGKLAYLKVDDKDGLDKIISLAVKYSSCSVSPMAAFMGGIIGQEIIKITGKYVPIRQWFYYDIFETLPKGDVNTAPLGGRYDDQIKMYGQDI